jgi:K+-sensing histidine kinase KdpD
MRIVQDFPLSKSFYWPRLLLTQYFSPILSVRYVRYGAQKAEWPGGNRMSFVKGAIPVTVTLAMVTAVTAVLWYFKLATVGPDHPVFFYLLPIGLVTIFYGSLPALLAVFAATASADFFLYDPLYSMNISSGLELGDLLYFSLLALVGVKCASELFRPSKIPVAKSRYSRP